MNRQPWQPADPLSASAFAAVRRRTVFECCKWDPQVGDTSVLQPAPLVLREDHWERICRWASALAHETLAAEAELLSRPALLHRLSLPRSIRHVLARLSHPAPPGPRLMRFDFHYTTEGWRLSECNSDVPGGLIEASGLTALVAAHYPDLEQPPDPVEALTDTLAGPSPSGRRIGLVHATAYSDDRQVAVYLARRLAQRGMEGVLLSPDQVIWDSGRARAASRWCGDALDVIWRFFPGEWLANLGRRSGWQNYVCPQGTPVCNPATALITQSKRFPLTWPNLVTPLPTWNVLLPAVADPRDVRWRGDESWVLKPAMGRVGEGIAIAGVTERKTYRQLARWARWRPRHWIVQRRFSTVPADGPNGPLYPCLGVFTLGDRVVGTYARLSRRPLTDGHAHEAAVLLAPQFVPARKDHHEDFPHASAVSV